MVYHTSGRPEPQSRELDPYALVHQRGWWYVIGYCHLRQEVRTFRSGPHSRSGASQPGLLATRRF